MDEPELIITDADKRDEALAARKLKAREYYLANKDKIKAKTRAWSEANRERKNTNRRKRYKQRHGHFTEKSKEYSAKRRASGKQNEYQRQYRAENNDVTKELTRKHHRKAIGELRDGYLRIIIKKSHGISDPSQEDIEKRRAIISAKRASKTMQLMSAASTLCQKI